MSETKVSSAAVLQAVRAAKGATRRSLAASLGMSNTAIQAALHKLKRLELAESKRTTRGGTSLWFGTASPDWAEGDGDDAAPIVQRIVPASTAPRLRPAGPASVWELAA